MDDEEKGKEREAGAVSEANLSEAVYRALGRWRSAEFRKAAEQSKTAAPPPVLPPQSGVTELGLVAAGVAAGVALRLRGETAPVSTTAAPLAPSRSRARSFFISHSSDGDGQLALALAEYLERAGQTSWVAPRNIPAGADWNASILQAIETCDVFVLLVSRASVASAFVKAEVQYGFERNKPVAPVLLATG